MARKPSLSPNPSTATFWPSAIVAVTPHARHYIGAALLIVALALAIYIVRANEVVVGPVNINGGRSTPAASQVTSPHASR